MLKPTRADSAMNWMAVVRYVVARTREPTTVHRAIGAVGGIVAGFSLEGPAKWVALIVGASNLIGILMPDASPQGYNDATSENRRAPEYPPIDLVGRPAVPLADQAGAVAGDAGPGADVVQPVDFVRQPVSAVRRAEPDTRPNLGGFGDRD